METKEQLKERILLGTIDVFNQKGLKFTMDDIAGHLSISKKTIYTVFEDKESMFLAMVDYLFDGIKASEEAILADESLPLLEKVKRILGAMPEGYQNIDFRKLYIIKDKYPTTYKRVEERLENGWESTMALLEECMKQGVIRPVPLCLVKLMMESALEQFFQRDVLVANRLTYAEALNHVVEILISGIEMKS